LTGDNQFATLGLVLLAVLANVAKSVGTRPNVIGIKSPLQDVDRLRDEIMLTSADEQDIEVLNPQIASLDPVSLEEQNERSFETTQHEVSPAKKRRRLKLLQTLDSAQENPLETTVSRSKTGTEDGYDMSIKLEQEDLATRLPANKQREIDSSHSQIYADVALPIYDAQENLMKGGHEPKQMTFMADEGHAKDKAGKITLCKEPQKQRARRNIKVGAQVGELESRSEIEAIEDAYLHRSPKPRQSSIPGLRNDRTVIQSPIETRDASKKKKKKKKKKGANAIDDLFAGLI
jgi:hypothetical protein